MTNSKPKILITGGAGYIGSHCARLFLEKGYPVIIFDSLVSSSQGAIEILKNYGDLTFVKGDLRNKEEIEKVFKEIKGIKAALHFAALISVSESTRDPYKYFENNTFGSLNLIETLVKNKVKNLVFSSTCAVYGESRYLPVDENHPRVPTNPYGETKLFVENIIEWYNKLFGLNNIIFRYFNVCGAWKDGEIGYDNYPSEHLVPNAMRGALGLSEFKLTYSKVDTPDGSPIRDYIDVNDLVDAHYRGFEYLMDGGESTVINLGTGKGYSVEELITKVEKVANTKILREFGEIREGEYTEIYANYNKAKKVLGWEPKKSLEESLRSLKLWYEKHPKGYL